MTNTAVADAAVSPLARAIRFGAEVRRLRERAGISQDDLASRVGIARSVLSRVESPTGEPNRRSDPGVMEDLIKVLLPKDCSQRRDLERIILDAAGRGWWQRWRGIGTGQQIVAAIEYGTTIIRAYQMALIPGLAQTAEYAGYRTRATGESNVKGVVDARIHRQQVVAAADTKVQIVIEELALHRLVAPPQVMAGQLRHLVDLARRPTFSVRVLRQDAGLETGWAPTNPFSIYEYPDPDDPTIVLFDVVGQLPSPLWDPQQTDLYVQLHNQLAKAALSDVDSVDLIQNAANEIGSR